MWKPADNNDKIQRVLNLNVVRAHWHWGSSLLQLSLGIFGVAISESGDSSSLNDVLDCFALGFFGAFLCCCREVLHEVDEMTFCQQKIATGCDLSAQRSRVISSLEPPGPPLPAERGRYPTEGMTILIFEMRHVLGPLGAF